jgi:RNA polymerase-interacting CarD/CdnL/TRCF family regulator
LTLPAPHVRIPLHFEFGKLNGNPKKTVQTNFGHVLWLDFKGFFKLLPAQKAGFLMIKTLSDKEKLAALYKKLAEAEEKYRLKLSRFRGVAHESASGELSFSELKVREDFVRSLKAEIKVLEEQLGIGRK